jgi:hypothetical protein
MIAFNPLMETNTAKQLTDSSKGDIRIALPHNNMFQ